MFLSGALSRTTSRNTSCKVASSTAYSVYRQDGDCTGRKSAHRRLGANIDRTKQYGGVSPVHHTSSFEDFFYQALKRASLCKKHARQYHTRPTTNEYRRSQFTCSRRSASITRQQYVDLNTHDGKRSETESAATTEMSRDELRNLVDIYDPWIQNYEEPEHKPLSHPAPSPQIDESRETGEETTETAGTAEMDETEETAKTAETKLDERSRWTRPRRLLWRADDAAAQVIAKLGQQLDDPETLQNTIFETYQSLPLPRMRYLPYSTIRRLIGRLRAVEYKDRRSMLRFFCLMDDQVAADMVLTRQDWNSAMAYAGRWVRKVGEEQVETAIRLWIRMEREADLRADHVTFNILFDIAIKAGKFALAEIVLKEMESRNIEHTRFTRTAKITYYGIKRDGDSVRRSYKELVDAGDFVDSTVLNCVIASLIRAGEASAAEQVFERMKLMDAEKTGRRPNPRNWIERRRIAQLLARASKSLRESGPDQRAAVQDATPVAPSLHTYRLLIGYHSLESGNIDRVAELIREVRSYNIPVHGALFLHIFRGFHIHGGVRYSSWTKDRLNRLWQLFLKQVEQYREVNENVTDAINHEERGAYFEIGIVVAVIRAFGRCGQPADVLEIWEEISERWKPSEDDLASVHRVLVTYVHPLESETL